MKLTSRTLQKAIEIILAATFVFIPIIFVPGTSELFEFNKMLFTYLVSSVVFVLWVGRMIAENRIIFRRTVLIWPLIIFLIVNLASTFISIDPFTSIFGYYSRLNGGMLSLIVYAILYFALVTNVSKNFARNTIELTIYTAVFISLYAALEHYGASPSCLIISGEFNNDCWIQDVSHRVFATFGQPNWFAAWLAAVAPFAWFKMSKEADNKVWLLASVLFFIALLFTKSRSGLLAFIIAGLIFWSINYLTNRSKKSISSFQLPLMLAAIYLLIAALIGTPWTPNIVEKVKVGQPTTTEAEEINTGGTESGEIRMIVWEGAVDVWRHYPILGTGPETFAYSYYNFRPVEHNITSEWNLLYNKAHNEYLNYAANTGTLGLLGYVVIIAVAIYIFYKYRSTPHLLHTALLASYVSLLVTNFFGFSVVATNLLFFTLPALAIVSSSPNKKAPKKELKTKLILPLVFSLLLFMYLVGRYWTADRYYALAKSSQNKTDYETAINSMNISIELFSINPLYHDELARIYADKATSHAERSEAEQALINGEKALIENDLALSISPRNVVFRKNRSNILTDLSYFDETYVPELISALEDVILLAPTDARAYYNLALLHERIGETQTAIDLLEKTIDMKADYKDARIAIALLYKRQGNTEDAKRHLQYILDNIAPDDLRVREMIKELNA